MAPHGDLPLSQPHWLWCWHRVHCYFVYLTITQAAHCSLFLPLCHLSPITPYYANSSLHGYCSARHQWCHSSDWQLQNMSSMGCHPPAHTPALFTLYCSVYASSWDVTMITQIDVHHNRTSQRAHWDYIWEEQEKRGKTRSTTMNSFPVSKHNYLKYFELLGCLCHPEQNRFIRE